MPRRSDPPPGARRSPEALADPLHVGGVTYQQRMVRCGRDVCKKCAGGRFGHGPYWYAFWRSGQRTRSKYVGRELPAEISAAVKTSRAVRRSK
jgi:hypothetical protein